jgi:predicted metal-binding membrane protein
MAALRRIGRRPTLWVELGIAAAWVGLILGSTLARGSSPTSGWADGALWVCEIGSNGHGGGGHTGAGAGLGGGSFLAGTPMWVLMATAMMVPASLPAVSHVGTKSLFWRRRRATAEFLAVFLALWIAFGAAVLGPLSGWGPAGSSYALATALALAAVWQLTPLKRRAMLACHRSRPLPPYGWRASAGVADFALHNGSACVVSCWALMLAAAVAGPASLLWMAGMTGVVVAERVAEKPRLASRRVAALLAAAACGVVLAAAIG